MNHPELNLFAQLETERLILRRVSIDDAFPVFLLRSDEQVNQFVNRVKATSIDDAKNHILKVQDQLFWGIQPREEKTIVGTICLWNISTEKNSAEIGFELLPDFQGKGLMQEAIEAVLHFAFENLSLEAIEGWVHHDNRRSISRLEKNNFTRNEEAEKINNSEEMILVLTKDNYRRSR